MTFAYRSTVLSLDLATKLISADIRLHNLEAVKPDHSIIFVANHFTRIETFLLPHQLTKHTGRTVWSLGADDLFKGRIGAFLRAVGTVSTKDPDRDKTIIRSLLTGE
ncbi:1-acyl-sn-glycerol-3-phosphate acyltransferase, partial [Candidatus Sumerlaeota bacterium]|nr:1-acyl-sn-glycerol-3-phosphate acyltransferase [Candidatus Sumerlaeota bacterium]